MKDNNILISIDSDLKEKSKLLADSLGLSLSAFIRMLLIKEIKNNG